MSQVNYLVRVWNDITDYSRFQHIYIYAHQPHFYKFILETIHLLSDNTKIYLLDSPPGVSGYEGFDKTQDLLINNYGIKEENIVPIPFLYEHEEMINTMNESLSVVRYFFNNNIKNVLIGSVVFHLPRAFLSLLSASIEQEHNMNIFCLKSGFIQDWDASYVHSQGILEASVYDLLNIELQKINIYHNKGDLVSLYDAIEYINTRQLFS